jgi:hypothetical protein
MPYIIKKVKNGFKVCKEDEPKKCFSKKPLTEETAKKQRTAIILSEKRKEGSGKSDYVVAIPSYDRVDILKEKTLKLLLERGIKPEKIYIFVADKNEYEKYNKSLDKNTYNKIVIGKKGISYQRNFIIDYFDEGQYIIFMDDDISNIKKKKGNKVFDLDDLDNFFKESYKKLIREKKYLWTTKNMYNPFYKNLMKDEGEVGMVMFSGDFMGIINRKKMKIKITLEKGEGEQMELMLMYFKEDGGVIRFNNIIVISTKLTKGGKVKERGSVEIRKKDLLINLQKLKKEYPEYIKNIYQSKENRTRPYIEPIKTDNYKIEGGALDFNKEIDDDTEIEYKKINITADLRNIRDSLTEELMKIKDKIPRIERPRKKGKWYFRSRGEILGVIGRSVNFGCGLQRFKGVDDYKANKKFPEVFKLLVEYGNKIKPEGFEFSTITLNYNMKAKKHKDSSNTGYSFMTTLGDYKKGGLYVYEPNGKNPKLFGDLNNHTLVFNGSILPHKSQESDGDRFSLIFYKGANCKFKLPKKGSGKPADPELYQEVKEEIYKEQPKHSLYRSARIQKEYQEKGGEYLGSKTDGIPKWFNEKWISLNDYIRGEILPCGSSNTEKKYDEYPLCRPLNIAKKLGKENIKKMIKEKDKLKEKTLTTAKVLKTDKFNINDKNIFGKGKPTKFQKILSKMGFPPDDYLTIARRQAEKYGLDPTKLNFCSSPKHKLNYDGTPFGATGYNDYIIWTFLEKTGKEPSGTAKERRKSYRSRAENIKGKWREDKTSPNNLAINILW